jgi:hypothetical protein
MCTISGYFPIGATDQRRNRPFIELLRSNTASHPLCSEWLHAGDLPAAGDPLPADPQPSRRKQWLRLTAPVGLLVDEHHHDRRSPSSSLTASAGTVITTTACCPGARWRTRANWRW